jgi:KDO2-lipid IV(A) lauroyltransferase
MKAHRLKVLHDAIVGALAVGMLRTVKRMDRRRTADFVGWLMRKVGPLFKEHRIGRANLHAAFPEITDSEIETILAGAWDNLGRIAVEFAHLDEFCVEGFGEPKPNIITYSPESRARFERLIARGKPTLTFAAHLANWELPAVGATSLSARTAVLYRRPNIRSIDDLIIKLRAPLMGELIPTGLDAPVKLGRLLQSGVHLGMLADQHYTRGVEVTFFSRTCKTNPLIAMLARLTGMPIHGVRVVRKPDGNSFWGEVTDEIQPVRSADGQVDIKGTMQVITHVIEGWIREHPEQWLWLHRRWR